MTVNPSGNKVNLAMYRGDTESVEVTCSTPFSAGDTITMTVRTSVDGDIEFQKTVTEFDSGKAVIAINPGDTSSMDFGDYVYDIQWVTSGGVVTTLFDVSRFRLKEEVTY